MILLILKFNHYLGGGGWDSGLPVREIGRDGGGNRGFVFDIF